MSQIYVPGPTQVFVSTGASSALEFLGWTEDSVTPRFQGLHRDVNADFGGEAPVDVQYMGEVATVPLTLVRFNYAVYQKLRARCSSAASVTAGMVAGTIAAGTATGAGVGTLLAAEGATVQLVLNSPYVAKGVFSASMSPGLVFGLAYLEGDYDHPMGTTAKKPRITMRAIPSVNAITGVAVLYTQTIPTLPSIT